jgi:tetratricopeptide (TPR) repeat protein
MRSLPLILVFILSTGYCVYSQNHGVDSILNVIKSEKEDSNKVYSLNILSDKLWRHGKFDTAMVCANTAMELAEKIDFKNGLAKSYRNIGVIDAQMGEQDKALQYFLRVLSIYKELSDNTGVVITMGDIGNIYLAEVNYAKALEYDSLALAVNEKVNNKTGAANNYINMGIVYSYEGKYTKALESEFKALAICEQLSDEAACSSAYGNIGFIYSSQGNYEQALTYEYKSLAISEKSGDKTNMALNYDNIGNVYDGEENYTKALEFYSKGLDINREIGNKRGIATDMGNISTVYYVQHNYTKALEFNLKALSLFKEVHDERGIALAYNSLGNIYAKFLKIAIENRNAGSDSLGKKALDYYNRALSISREIGEEEGTAVNMYGIGSVLTMQRKYSQAKTFLDTALVMSKGMGDKESVRDEYSFIAVLDSATGNFKQGLEDFKKYVVYRDSLVNEANTKKTVQEQMNYEFEQKQAAQKAEQDKKDAIAEQERNKQKVIRNSFIAGFALMLALAFFIFRGYVQKQKANIVITQQKEEVEKQKVLVEQQKGLVEQKNKDILDSILYAKRLQDAILPPMSLIKQYLPESFVFYKPKDIVAGDFYWLERAGDTIFIAAADCTGHGVPGALVSVVCSNALNRTVKEFGITEPGKILDKVCELVLETFEKSEDNVQDGMDISLCALTLLSPKGEGVTDTIIGYSSTAATTDTSLPKGREGVRVSWAGANNSLWYTVNGEMMEIGPDKQPIGKYYNAKAFTTHTFTIPKISPLGSGGAMLYLFTDGYADQFGGPTGKKFKYKQFQEKLLAISHQPLAEQKNILEHTFDEWKGSLEQVDDVLVIGIRV